MGDVAMLPHALRALREAYPDLRITVATRALFRPFFEGLGVTIFDVDTKEKHHSLVAMWKLAGRLRKEGVDAVADAHNVWRTRVLRLAMWLRGTRTAHIDKGRKDKRHYLGTGDTDLPPLKHTVVRYCDVFRRLGFRFDNPAPSVKISRPNPMGEKQGVWIGFAPFSAHKGKTYPEPMIREAVALLSTRYERVFIHGGGGDEARLAGELEQAHPHVTALAGRLSLGDELALISHLDCVVSMDSLVMHLASLAATPVVSVWGATHPSLGFLGYGIDPQGVLQARMACRPCSVYGKKPCKWGDYRCLLAITPQMIADKVAEMINR